MAQERFFVYGSMTEGFVHFHLIKDYIEQAEPATILGTAYRLKVGFPVVLEGQDQIEGQLVGLKPSEILLALLDQFHGYSSLEPEKSLYIRTRKAVTTSEGVTECWCYLLSPSKLPKDAVYIEGGHWRQSLQNLPALTEQLTERQVQYILKLGSSKGREIVPIDLPLYRELMNLEIIVDKGRRLALSKLGHEVFRYLG